MRALVRFAVAAVVAATLVACGNDAVLTGPALGRPSHDAQLDPILIDPIQFMDITAGDNFACVRRFNGQVACWGETGFGETGRLANDCWGFTTIRCTPTPTVVLDPSTGAPLLASRVDAGNSHVCIADFSQTAWCWGANGVGEVGIGGGVWSTSERPTKVAGPITVNRISAGTNSSCAQLVNGDISCWGNINSGTGPIAMTNSAGAVQSLSVGAMHACFVPANQTAVRCIGANNYGQGGWTPVRKLAGTIQMNLFAPATSVGTEDNTTCANLVNGTIQCAGLNTYGMLGNNDLSIGSTVTPVSVGGALPQALRGVTVGREHACALDPNGFAYCWGGGKKGELGNGLTGWMGNSPTPVPVSGGHQFIAIAAGYHHTCAITPSEIWCWGDNFSSQLGVFQATPGVPVQAPSPPIPGRIIRFPHL